MFEDILFVCINRTICSNSNDYYDEARYAWKLSFSKLAHIRYVFAVSRGIVKHVFITDEWLPATDGEFTELIKQRAQKGLLRDDSSPKGRYGFIGRPANESIQKSYSGRSIFAVSGRKFGSGCPIRYACSGKMTPPLI